MQFCESHDRVPTNALSLLDKTDGAGRFGPAPAPGPSLKIAPGQQAGRNMLQKRRKITTREMSNGPIVCTVLYNSSEKSLIISPLLVFSLRFGTGAYIERAFTVIFKTLYCRSARVEGLGGCFHNLWDTFNSYTNTDWIAWFEILIVSFIYRYFSRISRKVLVCWG